MKKDLIITLIITILILFNHYAGLRQNEERKNLYKKNNENKIEYLFLSFFTEISFLLSNNYDLYKNEIKNNTDLKYFIKENIDYREFFNYKTQWKNKEMLLFFGNQININFINRYPNFKHMKIFQTFSKNVSVSINFYNDKKNKKFIFFIENALGQVYGKYNKNDKYLYIYDNSNESYLKI